MAYVFLCVRLCGLITSIDLCEHVIVFPDFSFHIQVKSIGSYPKGTATICYCHMEEIPNHEIPFESLHGSK